MDPNSGRLHYVKDAAEARSRGLVPVERDLTAKEQADLQIRLYQDDYDRIEAALAGAAVQPEGCCLDYPRCDCNSPPESEGAE